MKRRLLLSFLASACLLLPACVGKPPEILRLQWQSVLVSDQELGREYVTLSLFVRPNDPDGFDDLAWLYLINDEQELYWKLSSNSWRKSAGSEPWIGSSAVRLPDGSPLPAGEYRVLLRDVGGDSAEQSFRLPAVSGEQLRRLLPKVEVRGREIRVSGRASPYQLWLYDRDGSFVGARRLVGQRQSVDELVASYPALASAGGRFRFKVYGAGERGELGAVSGPYTVE